MKLLLCVLLVSLISCSSVVNTPVNHSTFTVPAICKNVNFSYYDNIYGLGRIDASPEKITINYFRGQGGGTNWETLTVFLTANNITSSQGNIIDIPTPELNITKEQNRSMYDEELQMASTRLKFVANSSFSYVQQAENCKTCHIDLDGNCSTNTTCNQQILKIAGCFDSLATN